MSTKKHLFEDDERESWTKEAVELSTLADNAIRPIVQSYALQGYNLRHIQLVLEATVTDVVLGQLLALDQD